MSNEFESDLEKITGRSVDPENRDLYTEISNETGVARSIVKNLAFMTIYSVESKNLSAEQMKQKIKEIVLRNKGLQSNG